MLGNYLCGKKNLSCQPTKLMKAQKTRKKQIAKIGEKLHGPKDLTARMDDYLWGTKVADGL